MIIDKLCEFADNVSVAAGAGTALIGNVMDTAALNRDLGDGEPIYLVLKTGTTEIITGGSAGTIQFFLVSDAAADLASAVVANCTLHLSSASLVTDDAAANSSQLNAGQQILVAALPLGTYERYMGILCTIGTTTVTAGTIDAFLTRDKPYTGKQYADALTVATGQ